MDEIPKEIDRRTIPVLSAAVLTANTVSAMPGLTATATRAGIQKMVGTYITRSALKAMPFIGKILVWKRPRHREAWERKQTPYKENGFSDQLIPSRDAPDVSAGS